MPMIYKIRVILDAQEDIFRDLELESDCTLEDLHSVISQSFGFLGEEMASFYTCDDNWTQDEEIPLFDMSESGGSLRLMHDTPMAEVLNEADPKMLYVYDYLNMWTFFVELADIAPKTDGGQYPNLLFSFGELPEAPPEKRFEAEPGDFDADAGEFEGEEPYGNYDDLDFDENWN